MRLSLTEPIFTEETPDVDAFLFDLLLLETSSAAAVVRWEDASGREHSVGLRGAKEDVGALAIILRRHEAAVNVGDDSRRV